MKFTSIVITSSKENLFDQQGRNCDVTKTVNAFLEARTVLLLWNPGVLNESNERSMWNRFFCSNKPSGRLEISDAATRPTNWIGYI